MPEGWRVKVVDFGLGHIPNIQSGSMIRDFSGNPNCIAPEIEKATTRRQQSNLAQISDDKLLQKRKTSIIFSDN